MKFCFFALLFLGCGFACVAATPQFVTFGFDDNSDLDGINWTLKTFEQFKLKASFFPTCGSASKNPQLKASWRQIYLNGHEIGNHTVDHQWGQTFDLAQWQQQLSKCQQFLIKEVGIKSQHIDGFRAPFLMYNNNTFKAMKTLGLSYDVSVQHKEVIWPYLMDKGSIGALSAWWQPKIGQHPGIWSLPLHLLDVVPDHKLNQYGLSYSLQQKLAKRLMANNGESIKLTPFDFNWYSNDDGMYGLNKYEVLAVLQYNLDSRIDGERIPLTLGFHSDFLSLQNNKVLGKTSAEDRRWVLVEFLIYAVSKPQVQVVRHIDVINWMRQYSTVSSIVSSTK